MRFFCLLFIAVYAASPVQSVIQESITSTGVDLLFKALIDTGQKGKLIKHFAEPNRFRVEWIPAEEGISLMQDIPKLEDPSKQIAVTYDLDGGRVGDSLISYFHAKWIAMEYGLPFLYKPFPDSEMFNLSDRDQKLCDFTSFKTTLTISKKGEMEKALPGTLVIVPYFPDDPFEFLTLKFGCEYFPMNWKDSIFQDEVRKCLQPKQFIKGFHRPRGCIAIAVHVRRGGTWDDYGSISRVLPLKFPPYSYYIEQVRQLVRLFPDQPLYVFIFTDDLNPAHIAKIFSEAINHPLIAFDWVPSPGSSNKFEEFYGMGLFDCLIRPTSNFSLIASHLHDTPLVIAPTHCYFDRGKIIVDEVEMTFNGKLRTMRK